MNEHLVEGYGVVYPKGFKGAGIHVGLKKRKLDLSLIYSEAEAVVSGVFTQNLVKAAPVTYSQKVVAGGVARALIVNSGNANACTGKQGVKDTEEMALGTAEALGISKEEVLVSSTGVIGVKLPVEKILDGLEELVDELGVSKEHGQDAAKGIMTTDLKRKQWATAVEYEGKEFRIGGMAKGSGMIHPNMATMLAFITTDIGITKELLDELVLDICEKTFNCITVDGDTSTNDMALVLANGASGLRIIESKDDELYDIFQEKLYEAMLYLSKAIVKDGEGATKFIEVRVRGAKNEEDAICAGKSVATSSLVKTAAFGEDANWGRILAAVGYSGIDFDPYETSIYIGSDKGEILVCEMGQGLDFDEDLGEKILKEDEIYFLIEMGEGKGDATIYTCDLTYDYVKINGSYRS